MSYSTSGFLKRQERTHTSAQCVSFSESGYLKRNLKGTKLERKHLSAPNVTGVFQHQSSKFNRGLTGERNHLGAPNVTRASVNQITERIVVRLLYQGEPIQVHSFENIRGIKHV